MAGDSGEPAIGEPGTGKLRGAGSEILTISGHFPIFPG
jgi:hypothetical protein